MSECLRAFANKMWPHSLPPSIQVEFDEDGDNEDRAIDRAFAYWDLDADGVLGEDELANVLTKCSCKFSPVGMGPLLILTALG